MSYQKLIAGLNDDSLAVRELSAWHLEDVAPTEAGAVAYNPVDAKEQRQVAVARWQKELPPGQLPKTVK